MENLRSFTVTYLPYTNTKPARVSIFDNRHRKRKIIPYHNDSSEHTGHEEIAFDYLESIGIVCWYQTQGKKGFILLTKDFATQLK